MPDSTSQRPQLLPTVSIVEGTMRQSRRAVMLALAGAVAITLVLLGERMWSGEAMKAAADRHAQAYRLAADLRSTQQQLTSAAQLAAVTGDSAWIDRFDRLVPELARTTEHAALLAPPEAALRFENQTREASATLSRMHLSALEAMGSGGAAAARGLLESDRYRKLSAEVQQATESLTTASLEATAARVDELRERSYFVAAAMLLTTVALGFTLWRRLSSNLTNSRGSLMDAEERIQRLAASDLLTGLDNRAALHDAMQQLMARARRTEHSLAVLMVDLDRFKPVNDRHGHMVGDMVLKEVARRLTRCVRQGDLLARYGGDEFVVVVDETGGVGQAVSTAETIIDRMAQPIQFGDLVVSVGASVGMARFPADAFTDDELLRKADSALYRAKQAGRGGVCLYESRLDERLSERHALEQELREAIAGGQLVPFYQPIVDLSQRSVRSLELLCRWRHPVRGLLAPDKFIAVAEDSGLIGPLTMSLLDQACKDIAKFPGPWRMSFNVAPRQIQDETLVPQLLKILAANAVPPSRIDVELTETALVNDTARARSVILALKRAGMTVTLDDFGTGYSSLSYLAEMTFDKIKIDRSFVRTLHDRPESAKIVDAIVGLSRSLGVHTVAEGVETEEQARALQRLGCTFAQGYLFGRPVRAAELSDRAALAKDLILVPAS
ncbi:MAG: EAL domain-containing protein [Rubrivivax sp.]|nr:EAL domain-containing protein [Rubrivivax sp.]